MCNDGCERVNDCVSVYSYTHERAQAEAGPPLQHCCDSRDAGESCVKGGCVPGAAREPASPPVSLLVVFSPLSGWHLSWVGVHTQPQPPGLGGKALALGVDGNSLAWTPVK